MIDPGFCTQGEYIKSFQRDDESSQNGCDLAHVTHFYRATAMLSAVYAVVVCLCVCHTPVLYQNG